MSGTVHFFVRLNSILPRCQGSHLIYFLQRVRYAMEATIHAVVECDGSSNCRFHRRSEGEGEPFALTCAFLASDDKNFV